MGRPRYEPTDEQRFTVAQAARIGMQERDIRLLVKSSNGRAIARNTLRRCFKDELKEGQNEAHFKVLSAAYSVASNPMHDKFATMNIWYQKTQLGLSEKTVVEQTGPDGQPLPMAPLVILTPGSIES